MISRIRLAGLLVLALCACAVSVASASAAAPEFFHELRCEKLTTKTGRFTNSTCTTESAKKEGEFEARGVKAIAEGSKITFTDKSGESKLEVPAIPLTITCTSSTSSGEVTGPKTAKNVVVKYKGCTSAAKAVKCNSVVDETLKEGTKGATEEIVTNQLTGTLKLDGTKTEETLEPTLGSGHDFTFIKCGTEEGAVRGAVSGVVAPVETLQTTGTLTFSSASGLTFASHPSTLTTKDELTFAEAIEVT